MYLRFQCRFSGGEQILIPSRVSPKEYMNHDSGDRGLGSSKNEYTYDFKVCFGVSEDLKLLIEGPKGIYTP